MKKVLLATSALALTAGVAHAEITFSGKAEAGIYRSAPTAAVAAVAGIHATAMADNGGDGAAPAAADNGLAAAPTASATTTLIGYVNGVLTTVARGTGTMTPIAADDPDAAIAAASNDNTVARATETVRAAKAAVALAERNVQIKEDATSGVSTAATLAEAHAAQTALAVAQAKLAQAEAILAAYKGSAGTAKGKMPKATAYSGYDFNVVASSTTDSGMTFGVDFDMGAGLIADQDDDRAMDAQGAAVAEAKVTMSYNGVNIAIKQDGIDDLYDDTQNGDLSVSGSVAGLSYSIVTDFDDDVKAVAAKAATFTKEVTTAGAVGQPGYVPATFTAATAATAAVYNPTSYSLGYKIGDLSLSYVGTEHSDNGSAANKISATYSMGDVSVTVANDSKGDLKDVSSLSLAYSNGGMGITLTVKDDANHVLNTNKSGKQSQDVKITYAAGALGFTAATDESSNWWVNAQYDLGGGAQAFTTVDHTDFAVVGVNFAF